MNLARSQLAEAKSSKAQGINFVFKRSLLIEAITEGKWVVIDGLESTQMAILEIFNQILEPGSSLPLQTCHQDQTSTQTTSATITKHPDFRIFFVVDITKEHKISKAFRSRCVELTYLFDFLRKSELTIISDLSPPSSMALPEILH